MTSAAFRSIRHLLPRTLCHREEPTGDAAIHPKYQLDCFVASLLAMTRFDTAMEAARQSRFFAGALALLASLPSLRIRKSKIENRKWAPPLLALAVLVLPIRVHAKPSADAPVASDDVRFEQRIGNVLPLTTRFTDSTGASHALGDFFHRQPVLLEFRYARCPQLCSVIADGTTEVLRHLRPTVGRDLQVVIVSIDPTETRADARAEEAGMIRRYGRTDAAAGWHYLTADEASIRGVADAAGFHYRYDPRSKQYAHASGFVIATPNGELSQYFFGVDFDAKSVAAAIDRAAQGETGSSVYELLLRCFHGDIIGGKYGPLIWRTLEVSVSLTIAALFGGVGWMLYTEWRERHAPSLP